MRRIRRNDRISGSLPDRRRERPPVDDDSPVVIAFPEVAPRAGGCPCEVAVRMAYWNMIAFGHGHFRAFRVADRVFRWHLPTVADETRETRILCWVQSGPLN